MDDYKQQLDDLLTTTAKQSASDLHLAVGRRPTLRIDGVLIPLEKQPIMTPESAEGIISQMLTPEQKAKLLTQRQIDFAYSFEEKARFRVNVYFQRGYLAAALRLIPTRIKTIEELNLPPLLHDFTQLTQGFILVVGPAGHGKSSTLAAMVDEINHTRTDHIITIEDPVEYLFTQDKCIVSQREVGSDTTSFHAALRTVLRQDPDVVMIGEMRDGVSIGTAMTASETGHLVLQHAAHELRGADDRPHHRLIPGRAAGAGDVPACRDARRHRFDPFAPAHLRRTHSRDGDHDRQSRHPQPYSRTQNIPDRPRHRDELARGDGHAQPLAREFNKKQRNIA